jgi:hypothetical protein
MWDIEVDVACVGAGPSTLASAVATTDMGASVLLAAPADAPGSARSGVAVQQRVGGFLGSWVRQKMDVETDRYLTALAEDYWSPSGFTGDSRMTVRTVSAMPSGAPPEPFLGSRLGAWNASCLASPYGMLFSSVSGWRTERVRTEEGQSLEVMRVGDIASVDASAGFDPVGWLRSQVTARAVDQRSFTDLRRIVFDAGRVVGVELTTPDGVLAVGIRHGLALSSGEPPMDLPPRKLDTARVEDLQLCIVGQAASRFLRIEVLGTAVPERPLCSASGSRLRAALRETRPLPSLAGRCGKLR